VGLEFSTLYFADIIIIIEKIKQSLALFLCWTANLLPTLPKECIVLAGGMPNGLSFPLMAAQFRLRDGSTINIDEKDMAVGLQYSGTDG
jgi:hypothetical protein